ncbi:sensor histidine kinase [Wenjunlia tyrosinilytica]|uniref:histidine kinase n=1 Tax=Wenjunlia tyrosinilytica TaxID=1544741 RepID=A0A917ZX21_9ACTN|nr:nitrate- and nitrite sensing domain-containing protein [Wenjunlia tyrosinilytica]GGO96557.1 histidine kinase [Wenjunlia tyrosinilytica]
MSPRIAVRRSLGAIRTSLVLLALVPSLTLTAVWGVTTTQVLDEGLRLRSQTGLSRSTGALGTEVTLALQHERRLSAEWLAGPDSSKAELLRQRGATDAAVKKLADRSGELKKASDRIRERMYPVTAAAESLEYYRSQVDDPSDIDPQQTLGQYTEIIGAQIDAFQELSQVDDGDLTSEAGPLVALEHAAELVSQGDAMLTLAWPNRRLSAPQSAEFARLVGARRWLVRTQITPFLTGTTKTAVRRIITSGQWRTMESVEDDIVAARGAGGRSAAGVALPDRSAQWRSALDKLSQDQSRLIRQRTAVLLDHSSGKARDLLTEAAWVSAGGLAAVLLSALLSWRITRSLSRRLRGLRQATLRLAQARLPDVVDRLNRGERIDVDAESPALDYGTDELGQVAEAFNAAQRTAVNSAVELADTRRGFQKVILGVARHSQNLVNRQLSTLDALEREHQDPAVLAGLYELDSTASQMRRYEENLVIISGGQPGRRWSEPVAVVDVLRGAVGEVAEYQRVTVHAVGDAWLAAPAVADVIHLLAELIENATVFSPAPNPVKVRTELVAKGLGVEIEDRGVGMSEEDYATWNRQLAEPPRFDVMALADDSRLGMFVVGRLAARHGIRITLRSSPFGGSTAIVLIPEDIVVRESPGGADKDTLAVPAKQAGRTLPQRRPRAACEPTAGGTAAARSPAAAPSPSEVPAASSGPAVPSAADARQDRAHVNGRAGGGNSPGEAPKPLRPPSGGPAPLPRRVPQTSLAAELREEPATAEPADAGSDSTHPAPSAEEAASSLSAFQRGTQHARDQFSSPLPAKDA